MSRNPFAADASIRGRIAALEASVGAAVRAAIAQALAATRRDVAANAGGVLAGSESAAIAARHGLSPDELLLLALGQARNFARPPISNFFVGAVARETESGDLVFGGNLEFTGAHIGNTVHGEGFVFTRAFSRGTAIETLAIGEAHPCAYCRQYLSEFAATATLTLIDPLGHRLHMAELYPWPFDPAYLGEQGIVAGAIRQPGLELGPNDLPPDAAARLVGLGRRGYAPYSRSPAAVLLTLSDGATIGGTVIESVSFNPTMSPLQAALIDLFAHGYETADVAAATIAAIPGAPVDYVTHARDLLAAVAPGIQLEVLAWA